VSEVTFKRFTSQTAPQVLEQFTCETGRLGLILTWVTENALMPFAAGFHAQHSAQYLRRV